MEDYLQKYMEIVADKVSLFEKTRPEGGDPTFYRKGIKDELEEVREEMEHNNTIHLEDELGDIMRNYLNLIFLLEKKGYISSRKAPLERSRSKYKERVADQFAGIARKETKTRQNQKLKNEHQKKYGSTK